MDKAQLPETGFIRLKEVLRFIPVSRSTWYTGIKEGRWPQPVKLSARVSAYRAEDIRKLISELGQQAPSQNS